MKSTANKGVTVVVVAMEHIRKNEADSLGDMVLNIPHDRNRKFEPQLIPKGQRMSDLLEEDIIGMYTRGMNTSDISKQVGEI